MKISRKDFLKGGLVGVGATLGVVSVGCGSDDPAGSGGSAGSGSGCGATGTAIVGNHGHALVVPQADLSSTAAMTYDIKGSAAHTHSVTLTPAELAALKGGQTATVTSTQTLSHDHSITVTCA